MSTTDPSRLSRILAVALAVLLVVPGGALAASEPLAQSDSADENVEFVRTSEEVRGYLLASVSFAQAGDTETAAHLAAEPAEEHWAILGPALESTNETLADSLQADLERLPDVAQNSSADEYETFVRETVFPKLTAADEAVVGSSTYENATFNAKVVRDVLDRSVHEYREGVSNGSVTDDGEYRVAQAFANRSQARYDRYVADTLSDHGAEEMDDLYEHLHGTMADPGAPADVERYVSSLTGELGEYTGIEVEQSSSVEAIERIEGDLDEVVAAYEDGNAEEAKSIIKQTYLSNFEGVEGTLIEENPELVGDLEAAFNEDLPALIDENASVSTVQNRVEEMNTKLETAEGILASQEDTDISLEESENESTSAATTTTSTPAKTTSGDTPGFTAVTGLVALVAVGLLARRN